MKINPLQSSGTSIPNDPPNKPVIPTKPDQNPDPTKPQPGGNEPGKVDPTRIEEPRKIDPTRIDNPPPPPDKPGTSYPGY